MPRYPTAHVAVVLFLAVVSMSCAAEHLEERDPSRAHYTAATSPVARPTDLRETDKILREGPAANDDSTSNSQRDAATYRCPMHPEVRSASPGTCPKCGMTLEKAGTP